MSKIEMVLKRHEHELLSHPNVIGVGVGLRRRGGLTLEEQVLVVLVTRKVPPDQLTAADLIPASLEGFPVDIQEVGQIAPQGPGNR